ncbi:MAG: energy transducer TonB, partial [Duncaniella sp.]|nr:energy transducer TonB [Duncaniella sp.]
ILNTVKATELQITRDEEVVEEIKSQDELKDTDTAVGTADFDKGTDDLNVVREYKEEVIVEEKKPAPVDDDKVWEVVEQKPQFPGGDAALMKWLGEHIKYPPMAAENNIQGRVTVQFVVTKTGAVGEVKVVRGKDPDLDKEAVRVVKSLPKFVPGKMNGHAVNVWYTLPVQFKLQGI